MMLQNKMRASPCQSEYLCETFHVTKSLVGPCDWDNAPKILQVQPQTQWAMAAKAQNGTGGEPLHMFSSISSTTLPCIHCTQSSQITFRTLKLFLF